MDWNDFSDFIIQDFKNERDLIKSLDEIMDITKDNKADWKKRESAIKTLGSISLGNYGQSKTFIKYLNQKLFMNFSIQILDLRSSLMKEACRSLVLCAKNLGNLIESALEKLISINTLFKVVNSANKLISETGAKTIKKIIKNVESSKILTKLLEQLKSKGTQIRLNCVKNMIIALKYYNDNVFTSVIESLEDFIRGIIHDANAEVRFNARKLFLVFREIFPQNAEKIFALFELATQKAVIEDMKSWDVNNISTDSEHNDLIEEDNEKSLIGNNLNEIIKTNPNQKKLTEEKIENGLKNNNNFILKNKNNDYDNYNYNNKSNNNNLQENKTKQTKLNNYSNYNDDDYGDKDLTTISSNKINSNYANTNLRNTIYNFEKDENSDNFSYINTDYKVNKSNNFNNIDYNTKNRLEENNKNSIEIDKNLENINRNKRNSPYQNENLMNKNSYIDFKNKNTVNFKSDKNDNISKVIAGNQNINCSNSNKSQNLNRNVDLNNSPNKERRNYLEEQINIMKNDSIIQNSKYFRDLYSENQPNFSNNKQINYDNKNKKEVFQNSSIMNKKISNNSDFKQESIENDYLLERNNEKYIKQGQKIFVENYENKNEIISKANKTNFSKFPNFKENTDDKISQMVSQIKSNSGTPSKNGKIKNLNNNPNEENFYYKSEIGINQTYDMSNLNKNYNKISQSNTNKLNIFNKNTNRTSISPNNQSLQNDFKDNFEFSNQMKYLNNDDDVNILLENTKNSQNKKFAFIPKTKSTTKDPNNYLKNEIMQENGNLINKLNTDIKNLNLVENVVNKNNNENCNTISQNLIKKFENQVQQNTNMNNNVFEKNEVNVKKSINNENIYVNNFMRDSNIDINKHLKIINQNNPQNLRSKSQNIDANISDILNLLVDAEIHKKINLLENVSLIFNDIYSNIENLNKALVKSLINYHISNYNINLNSNHYYNFSEHISNAIAAQQQNKQQNQIKLNNNNIPKNNDLPKKFLIQITKNLSKFIFFMIDFFTNENFIIIIKLSILHLIKENEIAQNAKNLMDTIKTKVDPTIIIVAIIQLVDPEASDQILNIVFEYINYLIPLTTSFFANEKTLLEFIVKLIEILKSGKLETQSFIKFKILDIFEILFEKYTDLIILIYNKLLNDEYRRYLDFFLEKNKNMLFNKFKSKINELGKANGIQNKNENTSINQKNYLDKNNNISNYTFSTHFKENNILNNEYFYFNNNNYFNEKNNYTIPLRELGDIVFNDGVNQTDKLLESDNNGSKNINLLNIRQNFDKITKVQNPPKIIEFDLYNSPAEHLNSNQNITKIQKSSKNLKKIDPINNVNCNKSNYNKEINSEKNNNHSNNQENQQNKSINNEKFIRNSIKMNETTDKLDKKSNADIISMLNASEYAYYLYFISSNPQKNIGEFLSQLNSIKLNQVDKIVFFLRDSLKDIDYVHFFSSYLDILIEKIIFIYEKFFDEELNDDFRDLFMSLSHYFDPDLFIQFVSKHINFKKSNSLILTILNCIKNSIPKIEEERLLILLPVFIDVLFELLTHHTSDVRKLAVFCIVEIYFILRSDFEPYLNDINQSQKNLINIFYNKKLQEKII